MPIYHASYRFYDKLIVTDRDTYFFDILAETLRTASGTVAIEPEHANAARVIFDFLDAVRAGRPPRASGPSVLPAMRVLQAVQDKWDERYGARANRVRAFGLAPGGAVIAVTEG